MTRFVLDVASYQGSLAVEDVARAGFTAVNLKTSHGLTQRSVHPDIVGWVARSKAAGLAISTFHWLDNSAPGAEQAAYAYERLAQLGLTQGTVHVVDCEADATEAILTSYVREMTARLGRPVAIYSADWWWQQTGRRWNGAALSPYLWGAPNAGYLGEYPGDSSAHWKAGWGGWSEFALIQYAVEPLFFPDGKQGTISVSKSAARDSGVWTVLTGGGAMVSWVLVPSLVALRNEINRLAPGRDKASDGAIGDPAHASSVSDHNPDETGNTGGVEDSDSINEVHAIDVDATGPWPAGVSMTKIVNHIVGRCRAGAEKRFRYIIWCPPGGSPTIWSASTGWQPKPYSGSNPHDKHAHFSAAYGSGSGSGNPENNTSAYGLDTLLEDDVSQADVVNALKSAEGQAALTAWAKTAEGRAALGAATWDHPLEDPLSTATPKAKSPASRWQRYFDVGINRAVAATETAARADASRDEAEVARDTANVAALLQAVAAITQSGPVSLDELREALRTVYGEAFDRAETEQASPS